MRHTIRTIGLCLAAVLAFPAHADRGGNGHDHGRDAPRDRPYDERGADGGWRLASGRLSLDEAVARVERQFGARAVRAEHKREGDRDVYRIRLLAPDGRVFNVTVDAETGEIR